MIKVLFILNPHCKITGKFTIVAIAMLFLSAFSITYAQEFERSVWLEDFAQLKKEMSEKYANLEWATEARGLDLKQLSFQIETLLLKASNETEARRIFESFLNSFGDGHLTVDWPKKMPGNNPSTGSLQLNNQIPLCERLNFRSQNQTPRINYSLLNNFKEIKTKDSKYFSIGVIQVAVNKKVGVIRIPIFSEYAFPDLCSLAIVEMKMMNDGVCNEACEEQIGIKAANLLTAAYARQLEVLKHNRINMLLVDITGNGGGTNWTEPAARMLSGKQLLSPRQQFIRHKHWTEQFKKRLEIFNADTSNFKSKSIETYQYADSILRTALLESQKICDRSVVWENKKAECSIVVKAPLLYPQSVLPFAKPGSLPNNTSSQFLFYPSRYKYKEGVYSGKIFVLVDRDTWSSAEYFTAMLKDNNAATIIGEPTGGAGCGYTNGGIHTILKNSGAKVKIPDCVRLRKDGSNEVEGITPDILIPWRQNDSRYQKVKRVAEVLLGL